MFEQVIDVFTTSLTTYYGTDWSALFLTSLGSFFIVRKKRIGCAFTGLGCVSGFIAALLSGQIGFIFGNIFQITMMCYGFATWKEKTEISDMKDMSHQAAYKLS